MSTPLLLTRHLSGFGRVALVATALVAGVAVAQWNHTFRVFEAHVVGAIAGVFSKTSTTGDVVLSGLGGPHPIGLIITPECTSALLVLPCVGAFCFYVLFRGVRISAALLGLAAGGLLTFVANEARIGLILASWAHFGSTGLWIAHEIVGSLISVSAVLLALVIQLRITARRGLTTAREF